MLKDIRGRLRDLCWILALTERAAKKGAGPILENKCKPAIGFTHCGIKRKRVIAQVRAAISGDIAVLVLKCDSAIPVWAAGKITENLRSDRTANAHTGCIVVRKVDRIAKRVTGRRSGQRVEVVGKDSHLCQGGRAHKEVVANKRASFFISGTS